MNAFDVLEGLPAEIYSGDTVKWKSTSLLDDYSDGGYSVAYAFREPASDDTATATGTLAAGEFSFTLPDLAAGDWRFTVEVTQTSDGRVITVSDGRIKVRAKPGTADDLSHAEKMLSYVQAELQARIRKRHSEYSISIDGQSRSLKYEPLETLRQFERHYTEMVNAERRARAGRSPIRLTRVRFS